MKATDFAQILRKLIKEEIRSVIREELKSALTPVLLEQKRMKGQSTQARQPMPLPKQKPSKDFGITMNGPLGDILRETANDLRSGKSAPIQESAGNEWGSMGHFDAGDAMNFGHQMDDDGHQMDDDDFGGSAQFSNDPTAAFVKDYSGVLNSSYEKSGIK
jgi:acetylornithine deacetylase/succinyl-diaminopimelate desuccinylase-like protein